MRSAVIHFRIIAYDRPGKVKYPRWIILQIGNDSWMTISASSPLAAAILF
jgi:hypothetical protein